jgi:hypothetical protein
MRCSNNAYSDQPSAFSQGSATSARYRRRYGVMTRDQYAESVRPIYHSGANAAPPGQSKSDRWLSWTPENVQSPGRAAHASTGQEAYRTRRTLVVNPLCREHLPTSRTATEIDYAALVGVQLAAVHLQCWCFVRFFYGTHSGCDRDFARSAGQNDDTLGRAVYPTSGTECPEQGAIAWTS